MTTINLTWQFYNGADEVFNALTDADKISQWSGAAAKLELKEGGDLEMFDGWVKGKILGYETGKSLSYSWKPIDWSQKADASVVRYRIEQKESFTEVSLLHENFPDEEEAMKHKEGWINHVFDPLSLYLLP